VALFISERLIRELLKTGDEGAVKAVEAIAVREDRVMLNTIKTTADLLGSVDAVVEVGDEAGDCPLEVDVVLPEGIVGIDQEGLVGRAAS
jgi:hypothetical protein